MSLETSSTTCCFVAICTAPRMQNESTVRAILYQVSHFFVTGLTSPSTALNWADTMRREIIQTIIGERKEQFFDALHAPLIFLSAAI